ncbi:MAG TPA: conjugative transposon protein TraK [Ohtaekwangia sp.]|nr:conjugative transposon protein TraK [Ohtaekwangia sp.]
MFKQFKNIDTAFKHIRAFSVAFLMVCLCLSGFVVIKSYEFVQRAQERIYILANGKALEAFAAGRKENIPAEARDHIATFHHYFFTLSPDDKAIQANIKKALYLADASAKKQYDNLRENGYYANIISGNISQELIVDSIHVNIDHYPFHFRYKARQIITRATSVVTRSLITEGFLRNIERSDNNSHGFLIEQWNTIENKDIKIENR